jgi:carbamoylphosphate synthase large subunit
LENKITVPTIHILMTRSGASGAAGILKCLSREKSFYVMAADANPNVVGRYINEDFETIPFASDLSFAETILSLCKKKNIHVVLPLVTKELIPLSLYQKDFELAGIKLLLSPTASLEIFNNKSRLYEFLQ